MEKKTAISFQTMGTSNLSRFRKAIDPSYFGIDERTLGDILTFISAYSKKVRHVNIENKVAGDWSPFFNNNLAFVNAAISCKDIEAFKSRFQATVRHINDEIKEDEKLLKLKRLFEITFELFIQVDQWFKLSRHDLVHLEDNKLADHLKNAIKIKLASHLADFKQKTDLLNAIANYTQKLSFSYDALDDAWSQGTEKPAAINTDRPFELRWIVKEISRIFKSTYSVVTYLKNLAPKLLEDSLENYPHHEAHISLLIAFVKAFDHIKEDANNLTKRHLDYYYHDILKQHLRPSEPDQANVYLEPAEHIVKSIIPAGTLLAAGIDPEGMVYTYATDHSVELNQAKITDIKNIHVAKNPIIGVGNTFSSISNIYSRSIALDEQGFALDEANNRSSFHTFGKDQTDISLLNRDMEQAQIGFALSSPVLILREGTRNLSIKYTFELNSLSALISFIEELTKREKLSPENAFYKLLNNIFDVRYTTDTGWFKIENYEILPPHSWTSGEIRIEITLDVVDPPFVSFDKELHGDHYATKWPILEFVISSKHAMYSYSYLKDLQIEACTLAVDVQKAKDLQVYNDLGKLDITKPFYPFGSTPDLGSYFLVGNEEMIAKHITDVSLDIQWHNLPRSKGGFESYYKDYPAHINTDSFKVGITSLSDFRFHPINEDDIQKTHLFQEDDQKRVLQEERRINDIDIDKLALSPSYKQAALNDYSSKTRSGFFKLEVMEPEVGFGQSEYPRLFSKAVIENSKAAGLLSKETKQIDLPNEPFAPQIRSLAVNYSAKATLIMNVNKVAENDKFSNDHIYHIHPFGNKLVFENGLPQTNSLMPQFDEEGYLLLGLENVQAPIELSFYFELEDNVKNEINHANIPPSKWRYLTDDEWLDFAENELVFDSTNNFTTSGIIKITVPAGINKNHRILPNGKYWLAVSTAYNAEIVSKIILIQANGVTSTWKQHNPDEAWNTSIPKNTITGLLTTNSDVNSVNQPFPSYGGRFKETSKSFYTRVSERLKHKNRAITPDDYEKIILDHFPFLFQAKCINHTSHPAFVKKGWITIIVVPILEKGIDFYPPKVNYNQLEKIQNYIQELASPYTSIQVINPSYEKVKVNMKVVMKNHAQAGEYVKKLENDLMKFICPWFHSNQGEMHFGSSIERDDILTYIEGLEYVHFLTKLSVIVLHLVDGKYDISDSATDEGQNNELNASAPWSVLIPSDHHEIILMDKPAYEVAQETRIETMKIGDDFIIIAEKDNKTEFPYFDLEKDTYYAIEIDL
jgi:hypothetical protein